MDLLQTLLKKIVYLIPAIVVLAVFLTILHGLFVYLGISTKIADSWSSFIHTDYLPDPGSVGISSGKAPTPTDTPTNITGEEANNYPLNVYGTTTQPTYTYQYNTTIYTDANPSVRSLIIIKNDALVSGGTITGTAAYAFMPHGYFLVNIENENGDVVMSTIAHATANPDKDMFAPWIARIKLLPVTSTSCTLVLRNENYSGDPALNKIIRIPTICRQY